MSAHDVARNTQIVLMKDIYVDKYRHENKPHWQVSLWITHKLQTTGTQLSGRLTSYFLALRLYGALTNKKKRGTHSHNNYTYLHITDTKNNAQTFTLNTQFYHKKLGTHYYTDLHIYTLLDTKRITHKVTFILNTQFYHNAELYTHVYLHVGYNT